MPDTERASDDPKEDWHIRGAYRSDKRLVRIQAVTRGLTVAQWIAIMARAQEEVK